MYSSDFDSCSSCFFDFVINFVKAVMRILHLNFTKQANMLSKYHIYYLVTNVHMHMVMFMPKYSHGTIVLPSIAA